MSASISIHVCLNTVIVKCTFQKMTIEVPKAYNILYTKGLPTLRLVTKGLKAWAIRRSVFR